MYVCMYSCMHACMYICNVCMHAYIQQKDTKEIHVNTYTDLDRDASMVRPPKDGAVVRWPSLLSRPGHGSGGPVVAACA